MSVKVHISPLWSKHVDRAVIARVDGETVGECFDQLSRQFPGVKEDILDRNGGLLADVEVFVNGDSAYPERLAKPVKDEDDVYIIRVVAGG